MNDDDYTSYGFMYRDCGGKVSNHEVKIDEVTWPEVLNDFVSFLEGVYGYTIRESIRIQEPRYHVFPEAWTGEYFSEEE